MLRIVADELKRLKKKVTLTSSNIAMIQALKKSPLLKCTRFGRMVRPSNASYDKHLAESFSCNKITAAFEYIG